MTLAALLLLLERCMQGGGPGKLKILLAGLLENSITHCTSCYMLCRWSDSVPHLR
jgi:hypothetical protein